MIRYLPAVFIAGFILEIASIIWVGSALGVILTILLLFCGVGVGVGLFKSAGANVAQVFRSSIRDANAERNLASSTMLRIIAGILFIVPGFVSDVIAALLLLPMVQRLLAARLKVSGSFSAQSGFRRDSGFDTIIEAEAVEVKSEEDASRPPANRRLGR